MSTHNICFRREIRKMSAFFGWKLIVLGFNDTSTLEGHFVSSPREREKRDRRESRGDEREGQGRKRNRNESEETEEIKTFPSTLTHYKDSRPCPTVSQYQLDAPVMKDTQHLCTTRPPPRMKKAPYLLLCERYARKKNLLWVWGTEW